MSADLSELFQALVLPLEQPTGRSLSAVALPGSARHRLAKDAVGSPCLLLRQSDSEPASAPIRLQHLMVSYGVSCTIGHADGTTEEGQFTIIKCSGSDPSLFPHFLRILSPIVTILGETPTSAAVRRAINGLVELFQSLNAPSKKSIQGIWAELLMIKMARDPQAMASAWHGLPFERVDFVSGRQRIEVKSSSTRRRLHHFSLEQLSPPPNTQLIVASMFVEAVGNGLSLGQLANDIRMMLGTDAELLSKFDTKFYSALGSAWSDALDECYDFELAAESLRYFDSTTVPSIRAELPSEIRDVHFASDLTAVLPLEPTVLLASHDLFAATPCNTP